LNVGATTCLTARSPTSGGAVKAKDGEVVVFSWFEYPSKEVRDSVMKKMMEDPRMKDMGKEMPFDGMRMIYGGFEPIVDE
jgi:uncharacterized protein YbaA (DUF1428 family)